MVSGLGGRPSRELGVKARIDLVGIEQVLRELGPVAEEPAGPTVAVWVGQYIDPLANGLSAPAP